MIWERLIKWKDETIEVLNNNLVEYNEPGMERFNNEKEGLGSIEPGIIDILEELILT